jgi:hypothetical protein
MSCEKFYGFNLGYLVLETIKGLDTASFTVTISVLIEAMHRKEPDLLNYLDSKESKRNFYRRVMKFVRYLEKTNVLDLEKHLTPIKTTFYTIKVKTDVKSNDTRDS